MTDLLTIRTIIEAAENPDSSQPLTHKLASMYDHQRQRADKEAQNATELRKQLDSMTERMADFVVSKYDAKITPDILDPTVWVLKLRPLASQLRMLSSHPRSWDKRILYDVGQTTAQGLAKLIWDEIATKVKEADNKEEEETPCLH